MQKNKQTNKQTKNKSKRYAFFDVLDHIYLEIIKINGVEFKSNPLVLKEAETKHKDRTQEKQNSPHH